ncbi:hypothetical protein [Paenibacillus polymyxa]|uniref:hypothetical protein n=1 Tax=Paenibacillus polymyxa TaxID=1406 RepID=UPI002ED015E8|nr:hypothetical protein [Paenibacillus polymyxa]
MTDFSSIQLPNDVRSSLLSGLEFIAYFGPWVVIILGFIFLPFIHLALVQIVNEGNKTAKSKAGSSRKKKTTSRKKTANKTTRKGTAKKSSSRSSGAAKRPRKKREKDLQTIQILLEREPGTGRTIRREIIRKADGTKTETRDYLDEETPLRMPPLRTVQGGKSGR